MLHVVGRNRKIACCLREFISTWCNKNPPSPIHSAPIHPNALELFCDMCIGVLLFLWHIVAHIGSREHKSAVGCGCSGGAKERMCLSSAGCIVGNKHPYICTKGFHARFTMNGPASTSSAQQRRNHPLLITPLTVVRVSIWDADRDWCTAGVDIAPCRWLICAANELRNLHSHF